MRIFVTGGTGGLGQTLVQRLERNGHFLTLLTRRADAFPPGRNLRYVVGDLMDEGSYAEHLKKSEIILHMAAVTHTNDRQLYYRVNTEGTAVLLKSAEKVGIGRFIYLSSRAVSADGGPYCHSKLLAEEIVQRSDTDWVILRPAEIYGTDQHKEAITKLVRMVEHCPVVLIAGDGKYTFAPVHVDDVVTAVVSAVEKESCRRRILNLSGPEELSCLELVEKIQKFRGLRKPVVHIPFSMISLISRAVACLGLKNPPIVMDQVPRLLCRKSSDISAARDELGYEPASLAQRLLC